MRYFYKDILSETRQLMFSECLNCTRNHWVFNKCVEDEILALLFRTPSHEFLVNSLEFFKLLGDRKGGISNYRNLS